MSVSIREATGDDLEILRPMFYELWTREPREVLDRDAVEALPPHANAPVFLACAESGEVVGFLYLRLRSYAEGCTESPVPFVEGWWVRPEWRGRGVGRMLMDHAVAWSRERGYRELASDTYADSADSIRAHAAMGFEIGPTLVPMWRRLH